MIESSKQMLEQHDIILHQRQTMHINGVSDIYSFDENAILLSTRCGTMSIEGESLHISKLSLESGEIDISGNIVALFYHD